MGAYKTLCEFCERAGLTLELVTGSEHDAAEPDRPPRDLVLEAYDGRDHCVGLSCARPQLGDTLDAAAARLRRQLDRFA